MVLSTISKDPHATLIQNPIYYIKQLMHEASSPLVTVVIPVFNGAADISDAINSACGQSYKNIEIIVVDDGSTDGTQELVKKIERSDNRVKLIEHSDNRGVSAARNTGIKNSSGQYIGLLDADDIWHPDKVLKQLLLLSTLPDDFGMVYCWVRDIDNNGFPLLIADRYKYRGNILNDLLVSFSLGGGSTPLIKREVFEAVGLYDESLTTMSEDAEFYLRVSSKYKVDFVPAILIGYRRRPFSRSSNVQGMISASLQVREPYCDTSLLKRVRRNFGRTYFLSALSPSYATWSTRFTYLKSINPTGYKPYLDGALLKIFFRRAVRLCSMIINKVLPVNKNKLFDSWYSDINFSNSNTSNNKNSENDIQQKISVVIPAYNVENYICSCLDSVTSQNYRNIEIIIVNDNSTDGTLQKINQFARVDNRIRVITNPSNLGVCASRNIGIKETQSNLVLILDADDLLAANAIHSLANKMHQSPTVVLAYGARLILDSDGKFPITRAGQLTIAKTTPENALIVSSLVGLGGGFIFRKFLPHHSSAYYDENMKLSGNESYADQLFYNQAARYGDIAHVNDLVVGYRTGRDSSMSNDNNGLKESFEYFFKKCAEINGNAPANYKLEYARTCFYLHYALKIYKERGFNSAIKVLSSCPSYKWLAVFNTIHNWINIILNRSVNHILNRKRCKVRVEFLDTLSLNNRINYPIVSQFTKF